MKKEKKMAGQLTLLPPLPPFMDCSASDINDVGDIIGESSRSVGNVTSMIVTLWKNGAPSSPVDYPGPTLGLRINNQGNFLFRGQSPGRLSGSYGLYKPIGNATVDLHTIVPNLWEVLAINDHDLMLGSVFAQDPRVPDHLILFNINGYLRHLPNIGGISSSNILGVDNDGRVAIQLASATQNTKLYWLPRESDAWLQCDLPILSDSVPCLNKEGLVGVAVAASSNLSRIVLIDLNHPDQHKNTNLFAPLSTPFRSVVAINGTRVVAAQPDYEAVFYDNYQYMSFGGLPTLGGTINGRSASAMNSLGMSVGSSRLTTIPPSPNFRDVAWTYSWPGFQLRRPPWLPKDPMRFFFPEYIPWPWPSDFPIPGPVEDWEQWDLLPPEKRDVITTVALGELGSRLIAPELREMFKRATSELLERAAKISIEKSQ
ncbi:hypothetical protein [Cupriavidus sp. AcVe19-6a]|uniref:hypothetical protein n=1 Tax=Cupriavidus sp. AcVe19-6a TaxID=2821358 RepID=UPI001AE51793|nr:hypothetical protein [Cupriavidus sp. AcVe19-6a]MBP0639439.1 hypothetical protein [Cupriavidus sp. AcVe19-6a]